MHGEAGGEAKETNTNDFDLEVSYDGGKTYESVHTVRGNTDAITDRNLSESVTLQYFRLRIDDSANLLWSAIRIYMNFNYLRILTQNKLIISLWDL